MNKKFLQTIGRPSVCCWRPVCSPAAPACWSGPIASWSPTPTASAEDTMRAESYQDLVNSILLLIGQHGGEDVAAPALAAEEGAEAGVPDGDAPEAGEDAEPEGSPEDGEAGPENLEPPEDPIVYPPCPWQIRFYPDQAMAEIVEVLLQT